MTFPITPAQQITLPIYGSAELRFPVNNIYCVARNYADHAREMGHDPDREPPFFFMKPANALISEHDTFAYPHHCGDVHHEVEMVVAMGEGGRHIDAASAMRHVYGYAVGLDMTCRDVQTAAKQQGRPWESAKAFAGSAPCSQIMPASICGHPQSDDLALSLNGELRQEGALPQMIWQTAELISTLSKTFQLEAGDLIYTGTPAGVGPVQPGDVLEASLGKIAHLTLHVV
ncbi:MAG TPA: fumarylacetoacetate hydrolase [Gammaproteobacteria bacterium]|jgi:fumarylpyruvate hydrolase|nr:fumarylacetoacetate hydrolase [Gammaproteobacteria bacterium]